MPRPFRPQRVHRVHATRLQVDRDPVPLAELPQRREIRLAQRLQVTEHQGAVELRFRSPTMNSIWHLAPRLQAIDQRRQRHDQRGFRHRGGTRAGRPQARIALGSRPGCDPSSPPGAPGRPFAGSARHRWAAAAPRRARRGRSARSSPAARAAWPGSASTRPGAAAAAAHAEWAQRGATRRARPQHLEVAASSKWRERPVYSGPARSPGSAPATNTVLPPSRRATPRPSWLRSMIWSSNGVWSIRATWRQPVCGAGDCRRCGRPGLRGRAWIAATSASSSRPAGTTSPAGHWRSTAARTPRGSAAPGGWPLATAISR